MGKVQRGLIKARILFGVSLLTKYCLLPAAPLATHYTLPQNSYPNASPHCSSCFHSWFYVVSRVLLIGFLVA